MSVKRDTPPAPSKTIRVLLVDDHPLVREGLAEALRREPDLTICGEAEDHQHALALVASSKPHLAIIDLALKHSNGLELIKDIHTLHPKVRMLVVSMQDELIHAERALRAGASGYITKEEATVHVVSAVRQVLRGDVYLSQNIATRMASKLTRHSEAPANPLLADLTDRELEVFQLIGQGLARQQIAERLRLDVNTIETYRSRIKDKLQLKDASELLQFAIRYHRGEDLQT